MAGSSGYSVGIFRRQGGNEMVVSSGSSFVVDAGGVFTFNGTLNASGGAVVLPGVLGRGYINLPLGDAMEVSSADSLNPLTSGTNPLIGRINAGTDPKARIRWASGTGATDLVQWDVHLPPDVATAGGMTLNLYGEKTSGTSNALEARIFFGVGDTNAGSTVALTSSPANAAITIASGDIVANTPVAIIVGPQSVSGNVDLYGARLTYTRLSS